DRGRPRPDGGHRRGGQGVRPHRRARLARARVGRASRARAPHPAHAVRGGPDPDPDRRPRRALPDARIAPDSPLARGHARHPLRV
ncbi:MAG: RNA polymerase sigma factor SigB, partial [uncultured Solirubrobacterales bacterium]